MSMYEVIRILYQVDIDRYLQILQEEHGAVINPAQPRSYTLPQPLTHFYYPRHLDEGRVTSVLGFNQEPLSGVLILALANHPELAPPTTEVQWLLEQELLLEGTVAQAVMRLGLTPKVSLQPIKTPKHKK